MSPATEGFSAVARMARPKRVRLTRISRLNMTIKETAIMTTSLTVIVALE